MSIPLDTLKKATELKKHKVIMVYMDIGIKNSLPSTTDWLS